MQVVQTVGLVVVDQQQLLLAFSSRKQAWYLPGGKVDENETALVALQREIAEELQVQLQPEATKYYMHISAPAFGECDLQMEEECYRYHLPANWMPSAEVAAIRYFDRKTYEQEPQQVPGVLILFEQLKKDGLVIA